MSITSRIISDHIGGGSTGEFHIVTPPNSPIGLTAVAGVGQVTLSWGNVPGVSSYNIYRDGQRINLLPILVITYIDTTVPPGASHTYTVTSINNFGESAQSLSQNAIPLSKPLPPIGLYATVGILRVTLIWQVPPVTPGISAPISYKIYRGGTLLVSNITELTYTDYNVETGKTYPYVVTSVNTYGESIPTTSVSVVPAVETVPGGGPPAIPDVVGIRTTFNTEGQITRVQELEALGSPVTQATMTWNPSGTLKDVTEVNELGATHLITLNYVNGELDLVNPVTRTVVP